MEYFRIGIRAIEIDPNKPNEFIRMKWKNKELLEYTPVSNFKQIVLEEYKKYKAGKRSELNKLKNWDDAREYAITHAKQYQN